MDDYFIFNGIKSTDKNIYLIDYNPIFLSDSKNNFINLPGRVGSIESKSKGLNDIIINCESSILGEGNELIKNIENANHWLSKRSKLKFWNMIDKHYIGRLVEVIDVEDKNQWGLFNLQFRCYPLKISENKTAIQDIAGKTIINQGTYETTGKIIVNIDKDVDHLKVDLQNTGEFIYLEDDFKEDDEILIDLEDEYVKKNGNLIMDKLYLESDFFDIPVGEFEIKLSSGKGTLEYRERWL